MEDFKEFIQNRRANEVPLFCEYVAERRSAVQLDYLTEDENMEVERWVSICEQEHNGDPMDEGFLSKLVGGAAGFIIGPSIGRIVAKALGVEKGVLYDTLTSRLVSTAIGVAIAKQFGGEYKD